jgi:hypoxanthine phosphoribosyltransferase
MSPIKFSLRDHISIEVPDSIFEILINQKTLIVDDIFDSGETFFQLNGYIESKISPKSIKWASLFNNISATLEPKPDYYSYEINKNAHNPEWIVFPWENWYADEKHLFNKSSNL